MVDSLEVVLRSWQVPFWPTAALLVTALVYTRGWRVLRAQMPQRFGAARLVAFLAGLAAVFGAVASPLDAFAGLLLQAHMAQHLLLMMVAPPLLWLGAPAVPLLRGLPRRVASAGLGPFLAAPGFRETARRLAHPLVTWSVFTATVLVWHLPGPYELALRSPAWHDAEHFCFLTAGLLFWWPVLQPWPSQPVWPRWTMIPYLLLADLQNTILAGFLTLSERVVYPSYAAAPRLWGITPIDDQAVAGALMWVPGSIAFLLPAVLIVVEVLQGTASAAPWPRGSAALHLPRPRGSAALHNPHAMRQRRRFDLLTVPLVGPFLRWRYGRRVLQLAMLGLAAAVVVDGLLGPQMAPMNLAGVLPWTHWRALVVLALLIAGNFFCMACPFMLPRELAKRALPGRWAWPRRLRTKWLAAALLLAYLWAYEALAPWDSPWWTATIVLGYFGAAFAVDGLFRGASFCKYVCPIGQFNFVQSLASPLTVRARTLDTCRRCATHDCIRGNAQHRGCELELFQPEKRGNLDCTFCLDCVTACPHDNVGILAAAPARDLARDPHRSSLRRLSERPDVAALALLCVFGAFANAAGMTAPVLAWQSAAAQGLGLSSTLPVVTGGLVLGLVVVPAALVWGAAWGTRRLEPGPRSTRPRARQGAPLHGSPEAGGAVPSDQHVAPPPGADGAAPSTEGRGAIATIACRYAFALVPLGLGMWAAHFLFHLLTGAGALTAVVQRAAADLGGVIFGAPVWAAAAPPGAPTWVTELELLVLDAGWLATLYVAWRIAVHERGRAAPALAVVPWAILSGALWAAGVWIVLQPMEMRGMIH